MVLGSSLLSTVVSRLLSVVSRAALLTFSMLSAPFPANLLARHTHAFLSSSMLWLLSSMLSLLSCCALVVYHALVPHTPLILHICIRHAAEADIGFMSTAVILTALILTAHGNLPFASSDPSLVLYDLGNLDTRAPPRCLHAFASQNA